MTEEETSGTMTPNEVAITQKFEKDGFIVLRNLIPDDLMHELQTFYKEQDLLSELLREQFERGFTAFAQESRSAPDVSKPTTTTTTTTTTRLEYSMKQGVKHGFSEIVMRSPGRYEISLLNNPKLDLSQLLEKLYRILLQQSDIPSLLGQSSHENVTISNVSLVVSTPQACEQGWHSDGPHMNLTHHQPCHCLNVFVVLHDLMDISLGPTQLRPGTHVHTRNLGPMLLASYCRKDLRKPVSPLLRASDALLFDYRILHRGLANTTQCQNRTFLVVTVAQSWFRDCLNFPKRSLYDDPSTGGKDGVVEEEEEGSRAN